MAVGLVLESMCILAFVPLHFGFTVYLKMFETPGAFPWNLSVADSRSDFWLNSERNGVLEFLRTGQFTFTRPQKERVGVGCEAGAVVPV